MIQFLTALCVIICVGFGVVVAQDYKTGSVRLASNCEFVPLKGADARGHHWLCK